LPAESGARLVITHTRITQPGAGPDFAARWLFHLDTLAAITAGSEPPADRATWDELHTQYSV